MRATPECTTRPAANAAAVTAMAIRTITSSIRALPRTRSEWSRRMTLRKPAPNSRRKSWATGHCKATAIWQPPRTTLIAAMGDLAKGRGLYRQRSRTLPNLPTIAAISFAEGSGPALHFIFRLGQFRTRTSNHNCALVYDRHLDVLRWR